MEGWQRGGKKRSAEFGEGILEDGDGRGSHIMWCPWCPQSTLCNHLAYPSVGYMLCSSAKLPNQRFQHFVLFCFDLISEDAGYDGNGLVSGLTGSGNPHSPFLSLASQWSEFLASCRLPQKGREVLSGDKNGRDQGGGLSGWVFKSMVPTGRYATGFWGLSASDPPGSMSHISQ